MRKQRLNDLFAIYVSQQCSAEQEEEFMELLTDPELDEEKQRLIEEYFDKMPQDAQLSKQRSTEIFDEIVSQRPPVVSIDSHPRFFSRRISVVAASTILLLLLAGTGFLLNGHKTGRKYAGKSEFKAEPVAHDVAPGGNRAILTLANGRTIVLDSIATGKVATQAHVKLIKVESGLLSYQPITVGPISELQQYNKLTTPRGGQYHIVLSDNTQVWLNAASSIRYPTYFEGNERVVEITGEAYFEVAKNPGMPFKVKINKTGIEGLQVEVLGTHFNINAYDDENLVKTTLLEGSVKLTNLNSLPDEKPVILKPGQQAQADKNGSPTVVNGADVEDAIAWKNGRFSCTADLESIMRQISRWYDVEIVDQDKISDPYTVNISRNVPASQLLKFLQMSGGVHFEIEGKKVTVYK